MTAQALDRQPLVLCPFPSAMSMYADQVQHATMTWANSFTLVRSVRARERLNRVQYGTFMARAYPAASQAALKLIADWNTWLFLLDDAFDEHELGHRPAELTRLHTRLLAIMRGTAPHAHEDTIYQALHDLTTRFQARATDGWMRRFVQCVEATFAASAWEAHNRASHRVPHEPEYLQMRPYTSAVFCFLTLIKVAERMTLPVAVRLHADGWEISYVETLGAERLPPTIETALFRVAQEALTNVRKHARTTRVRLALERQGPSIRLEVQDWGCGFQPSNRVGSAALGERVGLHGMQDRAMLLGGECRIHSQPGAGTQVVIEIPLPAPNTGDTSDEA